MENEEKEVETQEKPKKRLRGPNKNIPPKKVIEALETTGGDVTAACRLIGLSKYAFYRDYYTNEEIMKARRNFQTVGFFEVTDVLYRKCLEGDTKAIAIYLRYNPEAKIQNWADSQTLILKEEKPLSDEEKEKLKQELFS